MKKDEERRRTKKKHHEKDVSKQFLQDNSKCTTGQQRTVPQQGFL